MDSPAHDIPDKLAADLHREADAARWAVPLPVFTAALAASAQRAPSGDGRVREQYFRALHLKDLALSCACAAGHEPAWELFVREYRPLLRRAADALDPSGGAREIADALYAELYGLEERAGVRRSLFRYFHGRSSLATWLRSVLSQRYVDAVRSRRRLDPLPDEDAPGARASDAKAPADPDRFRLLALVQRAFKLALAALSGKDRLRLACHYTQGLTLAQAGRILNEHEATVSRHLARSRSEIRKSIENYLRREAGLAESQISRAFEYALDERGPIDVEAILRKNLDPDRSI